MTGSTAVRSQVSRRRMPRNRRWLVEKRPSPLPACLKLSGWFSLYRMSCYRCVSSCHSPDFSATDFAVDVLAADIRL